MAEENGSLDFQKDIDVEEGPSLALEWIFPENVTTRFATNIVVQRGEHEYIISFFEAMPPILLGGLEDRKARIAQMKSVPAVCVARVVVSADRMPGFIQALQANPEIVTDNNVAESSSKE